MPRKRKCENCAKPTPPHNSISRNNRYLCARCCNETLAGPEFQHTDFAPLPVKDFDGATHIFHFPLRHLGDTIAIDAFEVIDNPDTDPLTLFGKLVQRIQRALAIRHIVETPFGPIIERTRHRHEHHHPSPHDIPPTEPRASALVRHSPEGDGGSGARPPNSPSVKTQSQAHKIIRNYFSPQHKQPSPQPRHEPEN